MIFDMVTNNIFKKVLEGAVAIGNAEKLGGYPPSYFATAQSVTNLTNGTTPAGDTLKFGGKGAGEYRQKTQTVIGSLPVPPTEEADYFINNGDSSFPYPYGHLEIRYGYSAAEFIATFKSSVGEKKEYKNYYIDGKWYGWVSSADGGNADTVDGYHASDFAKLPSSNMITLPTPPTEEGEFHVYNCSDGTFPHTYGIVEFRRMWDVNYWIATFKPYAGGMQRCYINIYNVNSWLGWFGFATTADLANKLDKTGGKVSTSIGSTILPQIPMIFENGINENGSVVQFADQKGYLGHIGFVEVDVPIYSDNNGNVFPLLHSGNYTDYAPTKTGSGASGTWGIDISGTAAKATADANGNNIASTYKTKAESANVVISQTSLTSDGSIRVW